MSRLTRPQREDLMRRLERGDYPYLHSRARRVCAYMESVLPRSAFDAGNRRERRGHSKAMHRHPRSTTSRERRKHYNPKPDGREKEIQEMTHLLRKSAEMAKEGDGAVSGPLSVVAAYAAPILLNDFNLDDSHTAPFKHWLMAKCGDVLRCQKDIDASIDGYLAWREACLRSPLLSNT